MSALPSELWPVVGILAVYPAWRALQLGLVVRVLPTALVLLAWR